MRVFTLYDDTNVGLIPADADLIGVYVDGDFQTEAPARARFPHATLFTITVHGLPGARCCDCESGDLTPTQAAAWAHAEIRAGRLLPWIYSSRDQMPAVLAALRAVGLGRGSVLLWSAHYDPRFGRHVCSPVSCGASFTADATQWTDRSHGRSLDESEFLVAPMPRAARKPPEHPHGTARFEGSVDLKTGAWTIHHVPGTAHYAGKPRWYSAEIQVCAGGPDRGRWRVHGIPLDSGPLGK